MSKPLLALLTIAAVGMAAQASAQEPAAPKAAPQEGAEAGPPAINDQLPQPSAEAYLHFCVALSLLRTGETGEGLEELEEVVRLDPVSAAAWSHIGAVNAGRGKLDKAAECYAKAVMFSPDNFRYRFEYGRTLLLQKKTQEGLEQWEQGAQAAEGQQSYDFIYQQIAKYHRKNKDIDKAVEVLQKALPKANDPVTFAAELIDILEEKGDWVKAAEVCRFLLPKDPDPKRLRLEIAKCLEKAGKWQEAVAEYDSYFADFGSGVEEYPVLVRAIEAARAGKLEEKAEAYIRQSIDMLNAEIAAGSSEARNYHRLGLLLARSGRTQQAVDTLRQALAKASKPRAVEIHMALATLYIAECQPAEAEAEFLAAIALDRENHELRARLGMFYIDMMRFQDAADCFLRAIDLADAPRKAAYHGVLSEVYSSLKQYAKAEEQVELILRAKPGTAAAWGALGKLLKDAGKLDRAAEAFGRAVKLAGEAAPIAYCIALAETYDALNQPEKRDREFDMVLKRAETPREALAIAYLLYERRHFRRAIDVIQANIDKVDDKTPARSLLGRLYSLVGEAGNADKQVKQLVDERPDDPVAKRSAANILADQKRFDEALKLIDEAGKAQLDEEQELMTRLERASLLEQMGRLDESQQSYRELLEKHPGEAVVNNNYGYFCAVHDRELDAALTMSKQALDAEPDNAAYLDTLGWILYKMGRYDAALMKLHQAYQKQPDAVVTEHLADALLKLDRKEQALDKYKQALELDPEAEGVEEKIRQLAGSEQEAHQAQ